MFEEYGGVTIFLRLVFAFRTTKQFNYVAIDVSQFCQQMTPRQQPSYAIYGKEIQLRVLGSNNGMPASGL